MAGWGRHPQDFQLPADLVDAGWGSLAGRQRWWRRTVPVEVAAEDWIAEPARPAAAADGAPRLPPCTSCYVPGWSTQARCSVVSPVLR